MRAVVKVLMVVLSVAVGAVFLYSAWTKVLPIQPFEYTLVEFLHLPWLMAAIGARLVVGMEATLGGLLVLHLFGKGKVVIKAAIGMIMVLSLYLVWLWATAGNNMNCGCFGDEIWMSPSVSLIKNMILLAALLLLWLFHKGLGFRAVAPTTAFLAITGLALPFVLYTFPTAEPAWLAKGSYKLDLAALYNPIKDDPEALKVAYPDVPGVDLARGKHIIAFLSPGCEHCRIAARKMSLMRRHNNGLPLLMIIGGIASDLTDFWKQTNAQNVPYMRLHRVPFLQYTGGSFPLILWLSDGEVVAKSSYNTLDEDEVVQWLQQ